ncbi:Bug family tripartite tricarboxylate transporter substrate binding protein [Roseomonas sp. BN140053]|uniref:Bug family tripartite tricarboxylate transporter substrate binding protein n=1 Tax=Roseomonas sp. BN140053 TaxID=3391898 RepID=UPI0039E9CDDC
MQRRSLLSAAGAAMLTPRPGVAAGRFPDHVVRLVVPFPPGGPVDIMGRLLIEPLSERWGHTVIVENRAGGGGGIVGTNAVAKSAPDGHTMGLVISAHVINPIIRNDMPYDTLRDLASVTQLTNAAIVMLANPDFPARTVRDVVELSKRTEGGLSFASPSAGTIMSMSIALLTSLSGAKLVEVPYQGSVPALTDVMQGRVPVMFDIWYSAKPHVEAGKLRVLGTCNPTPIASAPQIPLIGDTYPGFSVTSMTGLVAPAGTPRPILEQVASDIRDVLFSPRMQARLADLGLEPVGSTPAEFTRFLEGEIARWRQIVQEHALEAPR